MRKGQTLVLLAPVVLVLALVLCGCPSPSPSPSGTSAPTSTPSQTPGGSPTPTPTATPTVAPELTYNALNPRGIQPAVQVVPLAPRLDTLDGKLIYINQGEADPIIMPALWERVQKDFPKANWKYISTSSFGPSAVEADVLLTAKAVVRGISW